MPRYRGGGSPSRPRSPGSSQFDCRSPVGVAVLGALVNAHLSGDLTSRLQRLHIPSNFISIVINAIEHGTVPGGITGGSSIEDRVIAATYGAFRSGLEIALITSGTLMLVAAMIAAVTLNPHRLQETQARDF